MSINIAIEGGTSKRLLTAGKYCADDIIVTAEGGGVELNVLTASTLPAAVMDGQIVVIADTTPETVYIDTDAPASPATGDVWVKLEAEATVKLELTEESPYLRGGLTEAAQWDGNAWASRDCYLGVDGEWKKISLYIPPIGTPLNDFTWEQISKVAASGTARDYFSVGDAKEIIINGTVGNTSFNKLSVWAFIIGFDHNPTYEGANTIHFQIGMTDAGGTVIALVDSMLDTKVSVEGYFSVNTAALNTGGWENCYMRNTLLGSNHEPETPLNGSFMAALPSDMRSVMRSVTKYSDNTGGGSDTASYVTPTTDYLWLLAEYEVYGKRTRANSAEQNYQKQYAYYASGNSSVKYMHNAISAKVAWSLRSVAMGSGAYVCYVNLDGTGYLAHADISRGLSPCFCV